MISESVSEIQGPYGPIQVSERFLQLIWLHRRYSEEFLKTDAGEPIRILDPGEWNHLEGPDFRGARWAVGDVTTTGDVEIHFYAEDWYRHGHDGDAGFDGVSLHVTLFPPEPRGRAVRTASGKEPVCLSLLSVLESDLESLAEEEGLLQLERREEGGWEQRLLQEPLAVQLEALGKGARRRWLRKVSVAARRLEHLGWEGALHASTLEVLGFARNRAPMLKVARHFPLATVAAGKVSVETLFEAGKPDWSAGGARPANHPRRRLKQYLRMVEGRPEWAGMVLLRAEGFRMTPLSSPEANPGSTSLFRKQYRLGAMRQNLEQEILRGEISRSRLSAWVTDALLPLWAARVGEDCFPLWHHWYTGDYPDALLQLFRRLGGPGGQPPTQSTGWMQGLLALVMEVDAGYVQMDFTDLPDGFIGDGMEG